jgi:hypothetical protein
MFDPPRFLFVGQHSGKTWISLGVLCLLCLAPIIHQSQGTRSAQRSEERPVVFY